MLDRKSPLLFVVGTQLRRLRKSKKFSLERLSGIADMSVSALSELERGKRNITLETIEKYCEAMDYDPMLFLWQIGNTHQDPKTLAMLNSFRRLAQPDKEVIHFLIKRLVNTASNDTND